MKLTLPYWRYVNYTGDGCATYECLSCKKRWEGCTDPGWFDVFEDCEYTAGDKDRCYQVREVAIYRHTWKYCPLCGIAWLGPIRSNVGNERMLGPRRLKMEDILGRQPWQLPEPNSWWVIQERSRDYDWFNRYKANPVRVGALAIHKRLMDVRRYSDGLEEFRVIMLKSSKIGHQSVSEIYT